MRIAGTEALEVAVRSELLCGAVRLGSVLELCALRRQGWWAIAIHERADLTAPVQEAVRE